MSLLRTASITALFLMLAPAAGAERQIHGVVNMNTATPEQLQLLPGIGPAKVRAIVAYRTAHPFRTVDELARVKGIGRKMIRRLRLHLAVAGPTTAQVTAAPRGRARGTATPCPGERDATAPGATPASASAPPRPPS